MKNTMFAAAVWLGICAVASAHHSFAEFDMSTRVTAGDPYAPGGETVAEMTRAIPQLKGVIK